MGTTDSRNQQLGWISEHNAAAGENHMPSAKKQTALSGTTIQSVFAKKSPLHCWTNWPLTEKLLQFQLLSKWPLQFNFWTNWSLQGNTACSRQFWWKRLRTNYTTQCQHKDVSKDFRTRNYRLPSTKPPEMENYPGVANPDWSSAQGKTVTRCIIWRLLKKYYDSRKWARDEASPGPSIHSRKGRDGDTQTHQIIILGVS